MPYEIFSVFVVIVSIGLFLLWHVWLMRIRGGTYKCLESTSDQVTFQTDCGDFTVSGKKHQVLYQSKKGETKAYPFEQIKGIHYSYDEKNASLTEYFFSDFGILDLFSAYRDKTVIFAISLVLFSQSSKINEKEKGFCLETDTKIPVFVAKQYEVRDVIPVLPGLLKMLGLWQDSGTKSQAVLNEILSVFKSKGKSLEMLA